MTGRSGGSGGSGRSVTTMVNLPVIQPGRPGPASGEPPIFQKIGIVGLGLIGGSMALAARQLWPTSLVIAVDNKDVLETAMRLHAIDVAADDPVVLAEVDLVILAAPVRQNIELLAELDEHVRQPAVVTDTGSTKRAVVEAARALPPKFTFIGGHPLGGQREGRARERAAGSLQGPAVAADAVERTRRRAREAVGVRQRARRGAAHHRRGRARSRARVSQPPAAADRQRAHAGRGRRRRPGGSGARRTRTGRHDAAGVEPARRSGATSPRPTPTRSARRSTS